MAGMEGWRVLATDRTGLQNHLHTGRTAPKVLSTIPAMACHACGSLHGGTVPGPGRDNIIYSTLSVTLFNEGWEGHGIKQLVSGTFKT